MEACRLDIAVLREFTIYLKLLDTPNSGVERQLLSTFTSTEPSGFQKVRWVEQCALYRETWIQDSASLLIHCIVRFGFKSCIFAQSRDLNSILGFIAYWLYHRAWVHVFGPRLLALSVSLEGWQVALETFLVLQSLCSGFGQRSFQGGSFIVFS